MLFDIIYDYLLGLFNSNNLNTYSMTLLGQATTLPQWLALTGTIAIMILLIVIMCLLVRWCFRVCAGLVKAF